MLRLRFEGVVLGASEKNRRARFYSLTRIGRRQLAAAAENWERAAAIVTWVLRGSEGGRS